MFLKKYWFLNLVSNGIWQTHLLDRKVFLLLSWGLPALEPLTFCRLLLRSREAWSSAVSWGFWGTEMVKVSYSTGPDASKPGCHGVGVDEPLVLTCWHCCCAALAQGIGRSYLLRFGIGGFTSAGWKSCKKKTSLGKKIKLEVFISIAVLVALIHKRFITCVITSDAVY